MRIGIDLRFTSAHRMGTGRYAEQATLAIASAAGPDDVVLGFSPAPALPPALAKRVVHVRIPSAGVGRDGELVERTLWDAAISRAGVEVWFAPTGLAPGLISCPSVVTIHDLLFEHDPACFAPPLWGHLKREIPRSVASASLVVAISEFTRRDILDTYGTPAERVRVVTQELPISWDQRPNQGQITTCLQRLGITLPFIFHLSNLAPHKNPGHCLEVFAGWLRQRGDQQHRLVIAGGGPGPQAPVDLQAAITRLGLQGRVQVVGSVDDPDLRALFASAAVLMIPSQFEGWGLPPLEAMAMGTPAIVSDRGALPEAVGTGAVVLPLEDQQRWVDALDRLALAGPSPPLRKAMAARVKELQAPKGANLIALLREARDLPPIGQVRIPAAGSSPTQVRSVTLSGCMIIKNGVKLGYPFVEAITAVIDQVDEMVVVDGESQDGTWDVLQRMAAVCPRLRVLRQAWPTTTTGGRVIAEATNHALGCCTGTHILYVQADEIFPKELLVRIRELLAAGFNSAAVPFLHFRSGWDKVIANPAYVATIRCIPNDPQVRSVGDATSFSGPLAPCAMPEQFPAPVFHVGWVYAQNILAKHQNHAEIYTDLDGYQRKAAAAASHVDGGRELSNVALIDPEYELLIYRGTLPPVIEHLPALPAYDPAIGLDRWFKFMRNKETAPAVSARA